MKTIARCILAFIAAAAWPAVTPAGSVEFFQNPYVQYDHARQLTVPAGFGNAEFTLEVWLRPNNALPVGPTTPGTSGQLTNWSNADRQPYSSSDWWYAGNFLLDGHNNWSFQNGTFTLQFYGGGRVRWLFGDGSNVNGGVRAVGAYPASGTPSLLNGNWHQLTLVRRWSGSSTAVLEMWIDGILVDTESTPVRTNMRQWWDSWYGFPSEQRGWFWGAEKQSAVGAFDYEDYKGLVDELRFWSRAKSASEIQAGWRNPVSGGEPGLAGRYSFKETSGTSVCNDLAASQCMALHRARAGTLNTAEAPTSGQAPPPAPTLTLAANPSSVASGGAAMMSWSSQNATSCVGVAAWSGSFVLSGSESTGALSQTTEYGLRCSGSGGTIERRATITVTATPPPPPPPPPPPGPYAGPLLYSCPDFSRDGQNSFYAEACPTWSWNVPSNGMVASCGASACTWYGAPVRWMRLENVQSTWQIAVCFDSRTAGGRECYSEGWRTKAQILGGS